MYMEYDIAIIGGGPAGYTAPKGLRRWIKNDPFREERYRWRLPKRGMYPDKNSFILRQDTRQYQKCLQIWYSGDERPSFDLAKIIDRKNKTVRKLTLGVKARLTGNGVTIVEGEARITGEEFGNIRIHCDGKEYLVKNVLVCTGSETVIPPIKGLSEVKYWTSREPLISTICQNR